MGKLTTVGLDGGAVQSWTQNAVPFRRPFQVFTAEHPAPRRAPPTSITGKGSILRQGSIITEPAITRRGSDGSRRSIRSDMKMA